MAKKGKNLKNVFTELFLIGNQQTLKRKIILKIKFAEVCVSTGAENRTFIFRKPKLYEEILKIVA